MVKVLRIPLMFLLICLLLTSCSTTTNTSEHYVTKRNLYMISPSLEELVESSTYIVEVEVIKVYNSTIENVILPLASEASLSIVTDTLVKITQTIKGNFNNNEIIIRTDIGTYQNHTIICEAEPNFNSGEKNLLFLYADPLSHVYRVNYLAYGKYIILDENLYLNPFSNNTISKEILKQNIA